MPGDSSYIVNRYKRISKLALGKYALQQEIKDALEAPRRELSWGVTPLEVGFM